MAKFLLLQHYEPGAGEWTTGTWSPADIRAHLDYHRTLEDTLASSGELVEAIHVTGPEQARLVAGTTVTAAPSGRLLLARYRIVDVAGLDRALEIAALMSAAPGPGGRPLEQPIEVRRLLVPEPLRES
jgi:hypothetical protein